MVWIGFSDSLNLQDKSFGCRKKVLIATALGFVVLKKT